MEWNNSTTWIQATILAHHELQKLLCPIDKNGTTFGLIKDHRSARSIANNIPQSKFFPVI